MNLVGRWAAVVAVVLLVASLSVPITVNAEGKDKVPRVGVIGEQSPDDPFLAAFRRGLREVGYIEGENIEVEYRYAHGVAGRFSSLAAGLIRRNVDVLVVGGTAAARAAKAQSKAVPIVFTLPGDPVGTGLVASLARPGGNATGTSTLLPELSLKHLELLRAVVPKLSRVAVLYNPLGAAAGLALQRAREAARTLHVELQVFEIRRPGELNGLFHAPSTRQPDALLPLSDPVFGSVLGELAKLAAQNRLPAIYVRKEYAEAGGLMAYGPSFTENYRRAAVYVDKILKGAKPASIPVEQPSKIELIVNLKTAKALGLNIPQSLLLQADRVIE